MTTTRHSKLLMLKTYDGNNESDPIGTLARGVYDTIATATIISISICRYGLYIAALVVYDTTT